jgi:hypothetical protein
MTNSNRNDGNETYGGKVDEQAEIARRGLTYRGRFGADENRAGPNAAEQQREIDRVKG